MPILPNYTITTTTTKTNIIETRTALNLSKTLQTVALTTPANITSSKMATTSISVITNKATNLSKAPEIPTDTTKMVTKEANKTTTAVKFAPKITSAEQTSSARSITTKATATEDVKTKTESSETTTSTIKTRAEETIKTTTRSDVGDETTTTPNKQRTLITHTSPTEAITTAQTSLDEEKTSSSIKTTALSVGLKTTTYERLNPATALISTTLTSTNFSQSQIATKSALKLNEKTTTLPIQSLALRRSMEKDELTTSAPVHFLENMPKLDSKILSTDFVSSTVNASLDQTYITTEALIYTNDEIKSEQIISSCKKLEIFKFLFLILYIIVYCYYVHIDY